MTDPAAFTSGTLARRAVIQLSGADARSFLARVVANGPGGVAEGAAQASALLTPQGKVIADLIFLDDGAGGLFVDVPASMAETLAKRFALYRLRADAAITPRPDLAVAQLSRPADAPAALSHAPDPRAGTLGHRAIAPAGALPEAEGYDAARIAAGVPEQDADFAAEQVFSTDVNHDRLHAIDYRKGCFVGQEVASRMRRKGGVRKRTVRLSTEAAPGAPVAAGETALGEITSAAGGAALARVRIDRLTAALEAGGTLHAGEAPARLLDDVDALAAPGG